MLVEKIEAVEEIGASIGSQIAARIYERIFVTVRYIAVNNIVDRLVPQRTGCIADCTARTGSCVIEILSVGLFFSFLRCTGGVVDRLIGIIAHNVCAAFGYLSCRRPQTCGRRTHVSHRFVHGCLQGLDLINKTRRIIQNQIGFHLSHDTADILAAKNSSVVDTLFKISGLAAGDPANIVPIMLIADRSLVDAGIDKTQTYACNSANVGNGVLIF